MRFQSYFLGGLFCFSGSHHRWELRGSTSSASARLPRKRLRGEEKLGARGGAQPLLVHFSHLQRAARQGHGDNTRCFRVPETSRCFITQQGAGWREGILWVRHAAPTKSPAISSSGGSPKFPAI